MKRQHRHDRRDADHAGSLVRCASGLSFVHREIRTSYGDPQDRRRFVAQVRRALADDIERGNRCSPYACANAHIREPRRTACPSAGTDCSRPQLTEKKSPRKR